jgi:Zn-dependent alcohol dehydrogenases, class III
MSMTVSAAVVREVGLPYPYAQSQPLCIEPVTVDGPGPDQVRVRMASAGLCHSDLNAMSGKRAKPIPAVAGHEGAGVVVAVGEDVTDLAVGDHVVMVFVAACGKCRACVAGRPALCATSWATRADGTLADGTKRFVDANGERLAHWSGISAFAEEIVVARRSVVRIDPDVPLLDAAVFGCAVVTGVGAVLNTARVRPGDVVAVTGLGGVGLSAVMGAVLAGAARIIALDTVPAKLELARELGATDTVDVRDPDAVERVLDLTDGGVDFSFEMAGVLPATRTAYRLVRRGGALVLASLPDPSAALEVPVAAFVSDEKRILGSYMGSAVPARDIPRYVELFRHGRLPVDRLRSQTLPLSRINEGFDRLARGEAVRDVIDFGLGG